MKRALTLASLGVVVLMAGLAQAAPPKIGYIDLQRTLNETKAGKAAKAKLDKEKGKKQKDLDAKQDALKKDAEALEKQRVMLKADVVAQKEKAIQDRYVALQNTFLQFQQDLAKEEAKITRDIFQKAQKIIESIAKRDGYTIILEKTESAVLYADPGIDITAEVNKRMDAGGK